MKIKMKRGEDMKTMKKMKMNMSKNINIKK